MIICELSGTRIVSPCVSMGKMSRLGTPLTLFRTMFHFMLVLSGILQQLLETFSEPCQTSKMELFEKIVNGFQSLIIFGKSSILMFLYQSPVGAVGLKCVREKRTRDL